MILASPTDRAEATLLGRILLDEEDRATGRRSGPRLLDQVRRWGITSAALFGHTYTNHAWTRIQEVASTGEHATRPALTKHLIATTTEQQESTALTPHPTLDRPAELLCLTNAAEATTTGADRCAGMVVSGAMHRSVHTMAADIARAADHDAVATTISKAKTKLTRMRTAWERLPATARADLRALATPQQPPTPLTQAQADLAEARSWMTELRQDPAHAAQMVADPAWRIVDRLLGAVDTLANTSLDAPRSPDPGDRTFYAPGELLPDAEVTTQERQAHAADQDHDQEPAPDPAVEPAAPVIQDSDDQMAFASYDARRSDPARQAERQGREARLLGSLLADPSQLDEVDLDPQAFAPERRETAALIADMHQDGASIDPLALDWAAQARGLIIPETAIGEPVLPDEARGGLAEHVAQDHAEQRVESAIDELRSLALIPSAPENLITRAEGALDQAAIEEPQLEPELGETHEPEAAPEPDLEDEQEGPVPRDPSTPHAQDATVLEHR